MIFNVRIECVLNVFAWEQRQRNFVNSSKKFDAFSTANQYVGVKVFNIFEYALHIFSEYLVSRVN